MKKHHVATAMAMFLIAISAALSAPTYQQAVADYNAGKYAQAAEEFETLKQAEPINTTLRYYLALCRERLNQRGPARSEYEWLSQYGDAKLKVLATQGLARMSGARPSGTGGSSVGQDNRRVVRKVLEFTAEWCEVCKKFAPVFEATKRKYSDLQFEVADFDHDKALVNKYSIDAPPTVLFLNADGRVIYGVHSFSSVETFSNALDRFR